MAILEAEISKPVIDLSTEDGNVFSLIALVCRYSKSFEKDSKVITNEMMSGNYGNALFVFNREFGEIFDIRLPETLTMNYVKEGRKSYVNETLRNNVNASVMEQAYLR